MELVNARARTKGKSPANFLYQVIGKLIPRELLKDEKVIATVDDIDVSEVAKSESFDSIGNLYGSHPEFMPKDKDVEQTMKEGLLIHFNRLSRSYSSPAAEVKTKDEDGLYLWLDKMVACGVFAPIAEVKNEDGTAKSEAKSTESQIGQFRRVITQSAELNEVSRIEALKATKFFRQAVKAGADFSDLEAA